MRLIKRWAAFSVLVIGLAGCQASKEAEKPAKPEPTTAPRLSYVQKGVMTLVGESEIYPGVHWMQFKGTSTKGQPLFANVVDFDPRARNLRMQVVPARGKATYPRESTRRIAQRTEAIAAINGSYFHFTKSLNGKPIGLVKVAGQILSPARPDRPSFGILDDGTAMLGFATPRAASERSVRRAALGGTFAPPWDQAPYALEGGPLILVRGRKTLLPTGFGWSIERGREPRTAVGLTPGGRMYWVTVDGRRPGHSMGMTLDELSDLFLGLGASEALNWDGGGSTTMVLNGEMVTKIATDWCRMVSNAVVLLPASGSAPVTRL